MSEKRKKTASFCLKSEAGGSKAELFDAEQWEDGPRGAVRVRLNGRWLDGPDGSSLYLDARGVADIIIKLLMEGGLPTPPEKPAYIKGQSVVLPVGPRDGGMPMLTEQGHVMNPEPFLGYDSRWYVLVHGAQNSFCLMPCESIVDYSAARRAVEEACPKN
ncbi:hypothetical protein [Desulfovibrio sp.]|uniref:hypothetical protein n=1 Tax=Desulfovibrio sp. TaxID=885 RepID=UPI0025B924D1|nr:hypothetical protein [Desulfovibrio sp.]